MANCCKDLNWKKSRTRGASDLCKSQAVTHIWNAHGFERYYSLNLSEPDWISTRQEVTFRLLAIFAVLNPLYSPNQACNSSSLTQKIPCFVLFAICSLEWSSTVHFPPSSSLLCPCKSNYSGYSYHFVQTESEAEDHLMCVDAYLWSSNANKSFD